MVGHLQGAQLVKCRHPLQKRVKHEDTDKQGHYLLDRVKWRRPTEQVQTDEQKC